MSIYKYNSTDDNLILSERNIYGSSRVGVEQVGEQMLYEPIVFTNPAPLVNAFYTNYTGDKKYELSNHLEEKALLLKTTNKFKRTSIWRNVLTVITDRKLPMENTLALGTVDYYTSDVVAYNDYYPYGMLMPGRTTPLNTVDAGAYRYAFNGMEADDEIKNVKGSSYNYGARMLDPRIGRWLTIDPLAGKYPAVSPYVYSLNSPVVLKDPDGNVVVLYNAEGKKVATISKDGIIIEKGMSNSIILHSYLETKAYLKDHLETDIFAEFETSTKTLTINQTKDVKGTAMYKIPEISGFKGRDQNGDGNLSNDEILEIVQKDPNSLGSIEWDPSIGAKDNEGNYHSPALVFIHELFHGKHWKDDALQMLKDKNTDAGVYTNDEEKKTINEANKVSESLYQTIGSSTDISNSGRRNSDGGNGARKSHQGNKGGTFITRGATSNTPLYETPSTPPVVKDNTEVSSSGVPSIR